MPDTRVTRLRELQVSDRSELYDLLDGTRVGHIGLIAGGHPLVIPTAVARHDDAVLAHGSTGSKWMRRVAGGCPVCLTVTSFDGLMVARSAFESSFLYRSGVIFGRFERLEGDAKEQALDALVEALIPGRLSEVRPSTRAEINRTMVLSLPIVEWSMKVSKGWPEDGEDDRAGPAWAGVVPMQLRPGVAVPAPDLRAGIEVPPSVAAVTRL